MAGTHRVAVAGFAVDLAAGMAFHRVVTDDGNGAVGDEAAEDQAGQEAGQLQARPVGRRENALVTGAVAVAQGARGTEQVGDGAPSGCQDRSGEEELEAVPSRRVKGRRQREQERRCFRW
jgi:hypothetical protein